MNRLHPFKLFIVAATTVAMSVPAAAHHPLGGKTPETLLDGFLSGVGHPVIGFDHLAFIIAVGIASAFVAGRLLMPLVFILATIVGCLLFVSGFQLPSVEMVVSASVLVLGAIVMFGRSLPAIVLTALFALAGLFHGSAYAGAIVGAETTPLLAYLAGFGFVQYVIATAAVLLTRQIWQARAAEAIQPRLAGAMIAGVGLTFLVEHVEAMIFPGM